MEKFLKKYIICPYCSSNLRKDFYDEGFGIVSCECARYPILENIIFLKKDDLLTNKKLVNLIEQKKFMMAVYLALSASTRLQRYISFIIYMLEDKIRFLVPRRTLLLMLKAVGGNSASWYEYLLTRKMKPELSVAVDLLGENLKGTRILDIGYGIGHLYEAIKEKIPHVKLTHIGIDKNFLSLLISQLYIRNKNVVHICADVEYGIPLNNSLIDSIFYIDTFYQLFNSQKQIAESDRVLKKSGKIYILQLFDGISETQNWGYGIPPKRINKLFKVKFKNIKFFNHTQSAHSLPISKLHWYGYSCSGIKRDTYTKKQ